MKSYTINQLATMAGVSVRTLHHYDQIGLLRPTTRSMAGYRLYQEAELLRLQQILFYKELDLPLDEIRRILERPDFNLVAALEGHRRDLRQRAERLETLLTTIDKTIAKLTEANMELTDAELYEGFTEEEIERDKREVSERYDPALVAESNRRIRKLSREQWQAVKQEGADVSLLIAGLMDKAPGDPEVQKAVARHHAWIENFYPASAEVYRGLGQGYASDARFRAFFDKFRPGLADFMQAAMAFYAEHTLGK